MFLRPALVPRLAWLLFAPAKFNPTGVESRLAMAMPAVININ
jgi:hypothetical protein